MRFICRLIIKILDFYSSFGWKGIYSLFFSVNWAQDCNFENNGCDLISITDKSFGYFSGTYWQRNKWLDEDDISR